MGAQAAVCSSDLFWGGLFFPSSQCPFGNKARGRVLVELHGVEEKSHFEEKELYRAIEWAKRGFRASWKKRYREDSLGG
ncbi:hypothetical protein [Candidatus Methylacidithermus pantelleriae]|uniref:Uncharacterized protein n=1 Tax=Candidatus Methylacidithermus pantelleriae TaxID=2744239 RepID=A0A8J2BU44_9BACT|nr:hypothetical protein [Candidatus Methylacidithermus pantelleriae]CAF0700730.1 hypothetical protein MPNT_40014 [Candidatus Methylacidithermus pantelleriae]